MKARAEKGLQARHPVMSSSSPQLDLVGQKLATAGYSSLHGKERVQEALVALGFRKVEALSRLEFSTNKIRPN